MDALTLNNNYKIYVIYCDAMFYEQNINFLKLR
jgi:hypothetical protein